MSTFKYKLMKDRGLDLPGEEISVEADYYEMKYNGNSEKFEYIFYLNNKEKHIVRVDWVHGRIKEVA
jgi:hypothetical protein